MEIRRNSLNELQKNSGGNPEHEQGIIHIFRYILKGLQGLKTYCKLSFRVNFIQRTWKWNNINTPQTSTGTIENWENSIKCTGKIREFQYENMVATMN